jgi:galactose mutarotase-like enzyme
LGRAWIVDVEDTKTGIGFSVTPQNGGELSSLRAIHKGAPIELLHQGNAAWRGRAPWLFPAVGRSCLDGRMGFYRLNGKTYKMPIHGFVMDRAWDLVSARDAAVVCRTQSDASTRMQYPFDFVLTATYTLRRDGVLARVKVEASRRNKRPMPFSLGNHITFNLPTGDCLVRSPARKRLLLSPEGLLTGESNPSSLRRAARVSAAPGLRDMVLSGYASGQAWTEVIDPSGLRVRITQSPASTKRSRFVFYSDAKTFFCPEPWHGEPNSLNDGRALSHLAPGKAFAWELRISIARSTTGHP